MVTTTVIPPAPVMDEKQNGVAGFFPTFPNPHKQRRPERPAPGAQAMQRQVPGTRYQICLVQSLP